MDEELLCRLHSVKILVQIDPQRLHVLCVLDRIVPLEGQQALVADHVARQAPGGLLQQIGEGYAVKVVDPEIGLDAPAHVQGDAGLDILAAQVPVYAAESMEAFTFSWCLDRLAEKFLLNN